jgi:hypothetical protein
LSGISARPIAATERASAAGCSVVREENRGIPNSPRTIQEPTWPIWPIVGWTIAGLGYRVQSKSALAGQFLASRPTELHPEPLIAFVPIVGGLDQSTVDHPATSLAPWCAIATRPFAKFPKSREAICRSARNHSAARRRPTTRE